MEWLCLKFSQLTLDQLYDVIKLRIDVFVVEQDCVYGELDDKDRAAGCYHLLGVKDGRLAAYARLLAGGVSYENVSFGRVVTHPEFRGGGLGKLLLNNILNHCQNLWPDQTIDIGAQVYLQGFYATYGFSAISDEYLEDGIPHVDMRLIK